MFCTSQIEFRVGQGDKEYPGYYKLSKRLLCYPVVARRLLAVHAKYGGLPLFEDPLTCHGELCVAQGLIKADGESVTAEGDFKAPRFDVSGVYKALSLGGFFGRNKRWSEIPPDVNKFTVQECGISNRPCVFMVRGEVCF